MLARPCWCVPFACPPAATLAVSLAAVFPGVATPAYYAILAAVAATMTRPTVAIALAVIAVLRAAATAVAALAASDCCLRTDKR